VKRPEKIVRMGEEDYRDIRNHKKSEAEDRRKNLQRIS
jgi:hypothetical protein